MEIGVRKGKFDMKKISPIHHIGILFPHTIDGIYSGEISGYWVTFIVASSLYSFEVSDGVRGIHIPVNITIQKGDIVSVEINHENN